MVLGTIWYRNYVESTLKDGLIRARVFLLDHHVKSATVQLSRCWATPFADPKVEPFDLIDNL